MKITLSFPGFVGRKPPQKFHALGKLQLLNQVLELFPVLAVPDNADNKEKVPIPERPGGPDQGFQPFINHQASGIADNKGADLGRRGSLRGIRADPVNVGAVGEQENFILRHAPVLRDVISHGPGNHQHLIGVQGGQGFQIQA